jgi:DNA repair protein SbcC/Rad50
MRPRRLEIAGFTSFKEPTEIDFEGSDFFALVGPTGAGKSSVIDAMCFALYGSVPRYDNRNLVSPVISHGRVEAKVLLDFSIEGKDYTAVRVVRRSGKGATTKEARLESGGEVLAGNADELTETVTRLIGLSFEHFTRCVVLPQGEFARFLHDKPGERQDLVVKLLNLGVYEDMRQRASARATAKKIELAGVQQRLSEDLAFATPEALAEAKSRAKRLQDLRKSVVAVKPQLDEAAAAATRARAEAEATARWLKLVGGISVPAGVDELGAEMDAAQAALRTVVEEETTARQDVQRALAARAKLPARDPLTRALAAHDRRRKVLDTQAPTQKALERARKQHAQAVEALEKAEAAVPLLEHKRSELEKQHAAQHVAAHLVAGEPCPVCLQPVEKPPKHPKIPDLDRVIADIDRARRTAAAARKDEQKAAAAVARAEGDLEAVVAQLAQLDAELSEHPDRKRVTAALDAIAKAEDDLDSSRSAEDELRRAVDKARRHLETLQKKEVKARQDFDSTRDAIAPLAPPPAARTSLPADWADLVEWAGDKKTQLQREAEVALALADEADKRRAELIEQLLSACRECELEMEEHDDPLSVVVEAQTDARNGVDRISAAITTTKELRRASKTLEIDHKTAEELALHLSARAGRFESWLVNAALARLVAGATEILEQLSGDQYALTIDEQGSFQVVDRNNADETRSAKTLSGGETFLASLALALALADQLADLASDGAASLEAIFLDEGFGTLDPETLDTVAATVENLASSGRMVGIVTHVRELAERVPVQFRVRKEIRSSTVERVVA